MKLRAVIFDIYKTLLEVGPPPADAEMRWKELLKTTFRRSSAMSLAKFGMRCQAIIDREHAAARSRGIAFPEVYWPDVVCEVLPALSRLGEVRRGAFMFEQVRLWHTVSLAPGAAEVLARLRRVKIPLGLVSNCQPYTLRELDETLSEARLDMGLFHVSLSFLSYEHGFSKPDPHVFRILVARLADHGITAAETLIVGDREDNDIAPATAQGFRTWLLTPEASKGRGTGNWPQLAAALGDLQ